VTGDSSAVGRYGDDATPLLLVAMMMMIAAVATSTAASVVRNRCLPLHDNRPNVVSIATATCCRIPTRRPCAAESPATPAAAHDSTESVSELSARKNVDVEVGGVVELRDELEDSLAVVEGNEETFSDIRVREDSDMDDERQNDER